MKEYKKFLINKLTNFFEEAEIYRDITSLLGYRDSRKGHVIKIDDMNLYGDEDTELSIVEFNNPDGFIDGYVVEEIDDKTLKLIQKLNMTKISKAIGFSLDETQEVIKDYITRTLFYLDTYVKGEDNRGFYKLNKILSENIQTKNNDVYLVLKLLLNLVESTSTLSYKDKTIGKKNIKGSLGIKVGKEKPKTELIRKSEDDIFDIFELEPSDEPSDEDIKSTLEK